MYAERWKNLAKSKDRLPEAAKEYALSENVKMADAYREVRKFHDTFTKTFGASQ